MILVICVGILLFAICSPFLYSCITWNYSLACLSLLSLYTNLIVSVVLLIIYFILPTKAIDYILDLSNKLFRNAFLSSIEKTEDNIRKTFLINVLYPIPEKSINIWSPHGMSGVTAVIHNGYKLTDPSYKPTKGVVHSFFFCVPVVKDIIRHLNAIPSDYSSIKRTLEQESVSITLGGAKEMGIFKEKRLDVVVKSRKGIFKIALETGIPIVPIITYGENEIFPRSNIDFFDYINDIYYFLFKVRFPFPSLTSIQNWKNISKHPLEPIHTYTGKPILVKKIDNPSSEDIEKLKNKYIKRVKELFKETNNRGYSLNIT